MRKNVSILLIGCGVLMGILGLLTHQFAPDLGRPCLLAGVVGGGLCVLWGLIGYTGRTCRGWAILTMAATCYVLLTQVVTYGMSSGDPKPGTRPVTWFASAMLMMTFGTLLTLAYAGVPAPPTGDRASSDTGSPRKSPPLGPTSPDVWKEARRENRAPETRRNQVSWNEAGDGTK
jgi:hypothetical protein